MSALNILDCTLRDGGYVNQWRFSDEQIKATIAGLAEGGIEIVECGFISSKAEVHHNLTLFNNTKQVDVLIEGAFQKTKTLTRPMFVVMANFGDFDFDLFPNKSETRIDGVRVAFHKRDADKVFEAARILIEKGYRFFFQPMATSKYADKELIALVERANELDLYAMYIVDSFGSMTPRELERLYHLVDHNLKKGVSIGFHGHNNMQLAFANAIDLVTTFGGAERDIIVDTSVFGMGRGAGNVNTELFAAYCNDVFFTEKYQLTPILQLIDSFLESIYKENYWGYSIAHYLSAVYDCHPNYASFLLDKKKLSVVDIQEIMQIVQQRATASFDKAFIEKVYHAHISRSMFPDATIQISSLNAQAKLLVLASGPSTLNHRDEIMRYIEQKNVRVIAVNHLPRIFDANIYFFSNQKRYDEFKEYLHDKEVWVTSNLRVKLEGHKKVMAVDYDLLHPEDNDDAAILLLNLLILNKVKSVAIAGLDGYNPDTVFSNYSYHELGVVINREQLKHKNEAMLTSLRSLSKQLHITLLTPSIYKKALPMHVLGIIPARYKSSRFPGKPLAKIAGIPMIKRTYDQASKAKGLSQLVVATDDQRIYDYCVDEGMDVVMTSEKCLTGTDRVCEVAQKIPSDFYINIQGDEPVIDPKAIDCVLKAYQEAPDKYNVYNLYKTISDLAEISTDTIIKVVINQKNELMYMSRTPVPFSRKKEGVAIKKQVCVYGFTEEALNVFRAQSSKTMNEVIEDIEILRFLDLGYRVKMIPFEQDSIAVDVPADIEKVEAFLRGS